MLAMGFIKFLLLGWRSFLLLLVCCVFLSQNGVGFCQMLFVCLLRSSCNFVPFPVNMLYYVGWFLYVGATLYFWDKSHSVMVYHPFLCCWIWSASTLLRISGSTYEISVCSFLVSMSGFGISLIKWVWEMFPYHLFRRVYEKLVLIFL